MRRALSFVSLVVPVAHGGSRSTVRGPRRGVVSSDTGRRRVVNVAPQQAVPPVEAAIAGDGLVTHFQPVVELEDFRTVGYEALSRWPPLGVTPDQVFAAAAASGRLDQLDWACRRSAFATARAGRLGTDAICLVNVEPGTVDEREGRDDDAIAHARRDLRVVYEFTERDLLVRPAHLLGSVARARAAGHAIALDDLGAHPDSLALLDLVRPDIVKLDLDLVQHSTQRAQARTLAAVMAHHERTGAVVLAEGIEDASHLEQARACGATLGQGYLFGRPAPLPAPADRVHLRLDLTTSVTPAPQTPADLLTAGVRTASKQFLVAFTRHIETQADNPADPPVVLAALQHVDHWSTQTRRVYERLGRRSPLVAVLGRGVPDQPGRGVRGADLDESDPLTREWTVAALGAQTAVALIARDRGDDLPEPERRFDFIVTYDRTVVTEVTRSLMSRLV